MSTARVSHPRGDQADTGAAHALERYERYRGLHVLRLAGDDYEMGYQHGELLREAIARGPLPYFAQYIPRLIAQGTMGATAQLGARAAGALLPRTVGLAIAARFPPRVRKALDGLADGAKISRSELTRAVTMPETYL